MSINADSYDQFPSRQSGGAGPQAGSGSSPEAAAESGASPSAARLLEMIARETDQWRDEARSEAATIVADARAEAAQLVRDARAEAEQLVSTAREEAARTTNDARVEAYRVREETATVRKRHDEEVAHLTQVATDQREQLRVHLSDLLARVTDGPGASSE